MNKKPTQEQIDDILRPDELPFDVPQELERAINQLIEGWREGVSDLDSLRNQVACTARTLPADQASWVEEYYVSDKWLYWNSIKRARDWPFPMPEWFAAEIDELITAMATNSIYLDCIQDNVEGGARSVPPEHYLTIHKYYLQGGWQDDVPLDAHSRVLQARGITEEEFDEMLSYIPIVDVLPADEYNPDDDVYAEQLFKRLKDS